MNFNASKLNSPTHKFLTHYFEMLDNLLFFEFLIIYPGTPRVIITFQDSCISHCKIEELVLKLVEHDSYG